MESTRIQTIVSRQAVFIGQGEYAVNEKHLVIEDASEENLFVYRYALES